MFLVIICYFVKFFNKNMSFGTYQMFLSILTRNLLETSWNCTMQMSFSVFNNRTWYCVVRHLRGETERASLFYTAVSKLKSGLVSSSVCAHTRPGQTVVSCGILILHLNCSFVWDCPFTSLLYAYFTHHRTALTNLKCNTINNNVDLLHSNRPLNVARVIM
jgi:hypothetical protein